MKKFKITYIEGDTINKTAVLETPSILEALVIFTLEHHDIKDISSVEEVTE